VNTAATTSGVVSQSVGDENRGKVEQSKENFWAQAWAKLKGFWKAIFG